MSDAELRRLSKALALVLRHDAERLELGMDPEGFVRMEEVVAALKRMGIAAGEDTLREVVAKVDARKRRYTIVDDAIRANYGHSLRQKIEHATAAPPDVLYHGTTLEMISKILAEGLLPMRRQYVHLTTDSELAKQVGARRGAPCVLRVDARMAAEGGVTFMLANELFWLTSFVPARYLQRA